MILPVVNIILLYFLCFSDWPVLKELKASLRPLPFPESQRLMAVRLTDPKQDMFGAFGNADFIAFRDQQKSFSHVAAYGSGLSEFNFSNGSEPGRVRGVAVTADFFETLGLTPERGRTFQPQDDRAEAQPVVVVSHQFWQRQLNSDPKIVGSAIKLNGRSYVVTGVMRPGIWYPRNESVDVWPLMRIQTPQGRPPYYLAVFGRLRPGVSHLEAQKDGRTRVHIDMNYNPPAGLIGHAVAALLGLDPKSALDQDMVQLKSLLEQGKTRVGGHEVTKSELKSGNANAA